ncbi:MAG: DEAD/DEAH box helicase [Alphaproteobacteria bacterium]|nr:DEAD/DEAH box helicase [Alphaproteobacteria bacterium]
MKAIPEILEGRDLLGIAQTGTGKTAAFALPLLDRLAMRPAPRPAKGARILVLAPTRELASQIAEAFATYGRFLKPGIVTVFGGMPINRQIRQMERGTDILVATPGRLLDLIQQHAVSLSGIEVLVLDEADQMLDLGFIHALRRIMPLLPRARQTVFLSATMPPAIAELAAKFLTNPVKVAVAPVATTAERIDQSVLPVAQAHKASLLSRLLEDRAVARSLVFTRTKHGADKVARFLGAAGISAAAIHGNKSQPQRERALRAFKAGECRVLVATDIAARGIDIDGVTHVFNFDLPFVPEQYVHRIGRTARAGAAGRAIAFMAEDERPLLRAIERLINMKVPHEPLPSGFVPQREETKSVHKERDGQGRHRPPGRSPGGAKHRPKRPQPRPAAVSR